MTTGQSDAATRLAGIAESIRTCTACALSQGRTHAVPGEGPADAEVMFIGEGPGFYEDQQGRPFVGQAGKFLDQLLESVGWRRDQVYITNTVKCRPPNNRDPLPIELDTCEARYLTDQLATIRPTVLVTLGRFSLTRLFPGQSISRARGKLLYKDGLAVYPIYHPAAALHQQRLRDVIVDDFKRLPDVLEEVRVHATAPPEPGAPNPPDHDDPQQLSLL